MESKPADPKTTPNSRETIAAASSLLKALTNSGLDLFLEELGLPNPEVGRGETLDARIASIRQYALSNPAIRTQNGSLVGDAIVTRATAIASKFQVTPAPNVSGAE